MGVLGNQAQQQNLAALLHARSVAIVGISQPDRFGGQVYLNLRNFGYSGQIYGINPRYPSLYDQPCYPALSDLPDRPDCAILALPNGRLLPALQEAAGLDIPAAVIFASAYAEASDGQPALQERLTGIARDHHIAICGPNCMGFHSFGQKLVVSGYPVIPGTPCGYVTLITHSGSVFDSLVQNNRELYFNYAISSGNEMMTTLADYMRFALDDPTTRVVALFLEAARDPQGFVMALAEAARRDIPVVALKVGRSQAGARLAQAHSGALAGQDAAFDAVFAYYGVRRVKSLDEMMDTLELFATGARTQTRYISAMLDSGGERGMLVDLAEAENVSFAPINAETEAKLAAALDPGLAPINPLDAWGTGNEVERIYGDCLVALDADPATGLNVFAVDLMRASNLPPTYVDIVLPIHEQLTNPLAFLVNLSAAASESQMARLRQAGIPVLMGTETGLRAICHLLEYSHYQRRREMVEAERKSGSSGEAGYLSQSRVTELRYLLKQAGGPLDEYASKQLMRAYGISTPAEAIADSLTQTLQVAEEIGYPVALKTAAGELHKSDRGGVRLNLPDSTSLTEAYQDVEARFGSRVLVQQMVSAGPEILLGVVNDPQFGPMLALSMGGVFVEVFKDSRLLLLPASQTAVREALLSLRGAALLKGVRGQPPADVEAVVETALRLAALATDLGDLIAEIDINPLIVRPSGAVAVDALIIPRS